MATGLQRTFGTPTNNKIFTLSLWLKRASDNLGNTISLLTGGGSSRPSSEFVLNSEALALSQYDGLDYNYNVRAYYYARDVSAWYHIVYTFDSTQATASDRVKFYMNGVLQNYNMQNTDYPSLNYVPAMNNATNHAIGGNVYSGFSANAKCIMSHIHFIDGTAYDASAFGETDATTGEWKIKTSPSVTYGNNGFFILKDGNSVTDQSGNGNNWTVGGGTLTKTEDCPDNVFATLNPLDYSPNPATLQNGNTTYNKSSTGSGHNASMTGTLGAMTGKWYFEFKPTNTSSFVTGMIRTNHDLPNSQGYYATDAGCYAIANGSKIVGGSEQSQTVSYSANDIFGMAYDLDNGKFYFHVNGTYINSGDPTSGSTGTGSLGDIALGSNIYVPFVSNANYDQTNLIYFNFGNGYFGTTAVSSAGTNASGIGIFEHDCPNGYTALSTKGLNL